MELVFDNELVTLLLEGTNRHCPLLYQGGMKAVLWTDLFQSILMFLAMFAVVGVGTYNMGGLSNVWEEARKGGRLQLFK